MDVENREEDADPHGGAVEERIVLQAGDLDDPAVGRGDYGPRLLGHPPRRIAEKPHHQGQRHAGQQRPIPVPRCRQQRPAPAAASPSTAVRPDPTGPTAGGRAKRRDRRLGPIRTCSGCGSISGPADRGPRAGTGRVAAAPLGHAMDIARPKPLQVPPPPASPEQLHPITESTPRLDATNLLRQRPGSERDGSGFGAAHGLAAGPIEIDVIVIPFPPVEKLRTPSQPAGDGAK